MEKELSKEEEFEEFKNSGEFEKFKTKINKERKESNHYNLGRTILKLKNKFRYEQNFKDVISDIVSNNKQLSDSEKEEKYQVSLRIIDDYEQKKVEKKREKKIKEQLKVFRNSEEATDEEIEDFVENQKCSLFLYEYITDVENEITMIAHLITDKKVRDVYLSISNNLFYLEKTEKIRTKLANCNITDDDLSEYLINEGYSATDLKCILSFKSASDDVYEIYLLLSKYSKLRYYLNRVSDTETEFFLYTIVLDNFTSTELENYLDEVLERIDSKYKLKKDYKELPASTELDFSNIFGLFAEIEKSVDMPFPIINECIRGFRRGQLLGIGMLSNAGKTRFLVNLVTHLIFNEDKKVLLILNETTKEDLQYSLLTTALNNATIQEKYNLSKTFTEREFRNRQISDDNVYNVVDYIKEKIKANLILKITDSYTDSKLKNMIFQEHKENKVDYIFYDTLKVSSESTNTTDDLKRTATLLSELAKKYNIFIGCSFQLTDETRKATNNYNLDSSNIASSKQIYHIMDTVLLFKEIDKKDYDSCPCVTSENQEYKLKTDVRYYLCCLAKNRIGDKPKIVFEVDLDTNTWKEVGKLRIK